MTATIAKYRPPFISQKRKDTPPFDDCALESGLMLLGAWTLGEGLTEPDGDTKPLHELSATLRKRIGEPSGGLTLADVDDALHVMDPDLPPLPRYPGQNPPPAPSATLRLTWAEFRARIIDDHAAILLGYQPGATIGHAIFVARGNEAGPIVMDPWESKPIAWDGERWTWDRLRQFTERKVNGNRFGSPTAIACAVVKVGSETEAERVARATAKTIAKLTASNAACVTAKSHAEAELKDERAAHLLTRQSLEQAVKRHNDEMTAHALTRQALEACEAQSLRWRSDLELATGELEVLRPAVTDLRTQLDACEARQCDDCADLARQLEAERDGALERARIEQERANAEADRAAIAEDRITRAVEALTL